MMELFNQQPSNRRLFEGWYPCHYGMENRAPLFLKRMEIATIEKQSVKEFLARKDVFFNTNEMFETGRLFHDCRLHLRIKNSFIKAYYDTFYNDLNSDFYYHFIGTGLQGIYLIYVGERNIVYVGSVFGDNRTFTDRWKEHKYNLDRGEHHCKRLQFAYDKKKMFMPMIVWATNNNHINNSEIQRKIQKDEGMLIKNLWQNCYNKRKF